MYLFKGPSPTCSHQLLTKETARSKILGKAAYVRPDKVHAPCRRLFFRHFTFSAVPPYLAWSAKSLLFASGLKLKDCYTTMLQLRSMCFLELTGMPAESTFPCQPEDMPRLLRSNTGNFADHSRFSDMHIRTLPNHSGGKRIFFPAKYMVTQQEKSKLLKVNIQKWELSEQIMKILTRCDNFLHTLCQGLVFTWTNNYTMPKQAGPTECL